MRKQVGRFLRFVSEALGSCGRVGMGSALFRLRPVRPNLRGLLIHPHLLILNVLTPRLCTSPKGAAAVFSINWPVLCSSLPILVDLALRWKSCWLLALPGQKSGIHSEVLESPLLAIGSPRCQRFGQWGFHGASMRHNVAPLLSVGRLA